MCSEKIEKTRLRRATRLPPPSQNSGSLGRQSSIQWGRAGVPGGAVVVGAVVMVDTGSSSGVSGSADEHGRLGGLGAGRPALGQGGLDLEREAFGREAAHGAAERLPGVAQGLPRADDGGD